MTQHLAPSTQHPLTIAPIRAPIRGAAFDLAATVREALAAAGQALQDGDILAVSSKYAAISQGRLVRLSEVQPGPQALALAAQYQLDPALAQLILQESEAILGGIPGHLMTAHHGLIQAGAGIDRSNVPEGLVALLPREPFALAAALRTDLRSAADVGILITDSWTIPGRWGVTGLALAAAGFQPVADERGQPDLFGRPLQMTRRSLADMLAGAAQFTMGEGAEGQPLALIRGAGLPLADLALDAAALSIAWTQCLYVQSLSARSSGS